MTRTFDLIRFVPLRRGLQLSTLVSVWRERQALAALDEHGLRDVGLSRSEAETEAHRAPWDVPTHWRR